MKAVIEEIIKIEWKMFDEVNSSEGQSSVAEDFESFALHRESQFSVWSDAILNSYLHDIRNAQAEGRNLITEKYAHMLSSAFPEEFLKIKKVLPPINEEQRMLSEIIVGVYLDWNEEIKKNYPKLASKGRPLYTSEDTAQTTSFETYFRGELLTYSVQTLRIYKKYIDDLHDVNLAEKALTNIVKTRGFDSLYEAEKSIKD